MTEFKNYNVFNEEVTSGRLTFITAIRNLRTASYDYAEYKGNSDFKMDLRTAKNHIDAISDGGLTVMSLDADWIVILTRHGFKVEFMDAHREYAGIQDNIIRCEISKPYEGREKIKNIKIMRAVMGWGLKEAKEFMDELWVNHSDAPHLHERYGRNDGKMRLNLNPNQIEQLRMHGFVVEHKPINQFEHEEDLFVL